MITKEQFIEELNQDLALEYSAAIEYIQHASTINDPNFSNIIQELLKHADEEISHAKIISKKINYLGSTPTMNVGKRKSSQDTCKMIGFDLEGEINAIARYKTRIVQAKELKEFDCIQMLQEILSDENEHAHDLITFLVSVK